MGKNKKFYIVYQITNKINDNIYIGVHVTENINDKYFGSGTNIKKAIKEFGKENFEKIILYNFDTKEEMLEKEKELVNKEFIKRGDTYNICLGGGFNTVNTVPVKDKNGNTMQVHITDPRYLSGELVPLATGLVVVKDNIGNIMQVSIDDTRYLSNELVPLATGLARVKDKKGNIICVSVNDPRYLSGKLFGITKDMVLVKDKNGNTMQVHITDPRYLSGELVPYWQDKKHKLESRLKMSKAMKGKYDGEKHNQYGSCWIYNLDLKENKKIKKEDINQWLDKGWLSGRKMKF